MIAEPVRQMVLYEALNTASLTDSARRFHIADKTVQRIIDEEAAHHQLNQATRFPEHIAMDE